MSVGRDGGGVKAGAAVLDEGLHGLGAHLDVDGDGRGAVANGVLAGLGEGSDERE